LHVTGQRPDGYHELESLVAFCELGDRITVSRATRHSKEQIHLNAIGPYAADMPAGSDNIVVKACDLLLQSNADVDSCFEVTIDKHLPVASGIGGGSADAAAALIALSGVLGISDTDRLMKIGGDIGSDVPMCLHSHTLVAKGRGEQITPVADFPVLHLVLVNPGIAVETPTVFKAMAEKCNAPLDPLPEMTGIGTLVDWLATQRNDLQSVALSQHRDIAETLAAIGTTRPRLVRMSGSGATCFGVYNTQSDAEAAKDAIRSDHLQWWVVATQTRDFGLNRCV